MPYIGQQVPGLYQATKAVQRFNGDGSDTTFTLTTTVASAQDVLVSVNNVVQDTAAYTIPDGTTLTFSSAPSAGTGNIFVNYLSPQAGTIVPPAGSVTTTKIANNAVTMAKLATSGTLPALNGSALTNVGKVLQVITANKLDTFSSTSRTFVDVTGLSVQITPVSTSSKIYVSGVLVCSASDHWVFARLMRDSTQVLTPSGTLGNRTTANFGFGTLNTGEYMPSSLPIHALDSPSSTSQLTYKIQIETHAGTGFVNRTERDGNDSTGYDLRGVSTITVMEIAG